MSEAFDTIRSILLTDWDPIGIKDEPKAADEYDEYIGDLSALLKNAASAEEIANYLVKIEREFMGLPGDISRAKAVARSMFGLNT